MKRYGDNLPGSDDRDNAIDRGDNSNVVTDMVMYGGCGVRFGAFRKPVEYPKKRKTLSLWSLPGFKRKTGEKEIS